MHRDAGQLTRLEAAKVFFGAFALRTQAYDFHHSVGFTTFDSVIEKRMPLAKMSPHFEVFDNVVLQSQHQHT